LTPACAGHLEPRGSGLTIHNQQRLGVLMTRLGIFRQVLVSISIHVTITYKQRDHIHKRTEYTNGQTGRQTMDEFRYDLDFLCANSHSKVKAKAESS